MSGSELKYKDSHALDYATARHGPGHSYLDYASGPYVGEYQSSPVSAPAVSTLSAHTLSPLSHPSYPYQPRDSTYQVSSQALSVSKPRPSTTNPLSILISQRGPYYGRAGEKFRIELRSQTDFAVYRYHFSLVLGQIVFPAIITKTSGPDYDNWISYCLTVDLPQQDGAISPAKMPLLLDIRDDDGEILDMQSLDPFTYVSVPDFEPYPAPIDNKKRKLDDGASAYSLPMAKRSASQPQAMRYTSMAPSVQSPPPPIPAQYLSTGSNSGLYAVPSLYDKPMSPQRSQMYPVARTPRYGQARAEPHLGYQKVRSPNAPVSLAYSSLGGLDRSPQRRVISKRVTMANLRSPSMPANPQLVRTSVLEQSQASSIARGFNPYAQYTTGKAKLIVDGDLMSMTRDWTVEEQSVQRRLVEFVRNQSGNIVETSFKPVTLDQRTNSNPCVSCVYWQERDEYFVTSVDTIALLEGLIAARFTVEEKNRIRRNLEGYKPYTVSKLREDTDSFFRLIMGFPNPKPRNIEKDVKVFPWAKLSEALHKIFDKYSASSASTVSHIMYPTGASALEVGGGIDLLSPSSTTRSSVSPGHAPGMMGTASTALSPRHGGPASQIRQGLSSYTNFSMPFPVGGGGAGNNDRNNSSSSVHHPHHQDYSVTTMSMTHMTPTVATASNPVDWPTAATPQYHDYSSSTLSALEAESNRAAWDAAQYLTSHHVSVSGPPPPATQSALYARAPLPYQQQHQQGYAAAAGSSIAGDDASSLISPGLPPHPSSTPLSMPSMISRSPHTMRSQPTSTTG